jgi:ABC-2 type transport system permease protein
MRNLGVMAVARRSLRQLAGSGVYVYAMLLAPLFCILFLTSLMHRGLPVKAPAAVVDCDKSEISRTITRNIKSMQMIDVVSYPDNFEAACRAMDRGEIYGFFFIPRDFQRDLLSARSPVVTYYSNMTYFVPGTMLFKDFKTVATYTKAGVMKSALENLGLSEQAIANTLQPLDIEVRGIGNPQTNYAVYLCNSFLPGVLQLMILLVTAHSVLVEIKRGSSRRWLRMARGSVVKALFGKLLPQTLWWWCLALFLASWLFSYNCFPMYGSRGALILSELLYVLACQGFALFICCALPNLRLALSVCALVGILNFSVSAYSFPIESMYGAIGIFSYLLPARYNFLIYTNICLNGEPLYYSRLYFAAYIVIALLPFTLLWRLKRRLLRPLYLP